MGLRRLEICALLVLSLFFASPQEQYLVFLKISYLTISSFSNVPIYSNMPLIPKSETSAKVNKRTYLYSYLYYNFLLSLP